MQKKGYSMSSAPEQSKTAQAVLEESAEEYLQNESNLREKLDSRTSENFMSSMYSAGVTEFRGVSRARLSAEYRFTLGWEIRRTVYLRGEAANYYPGVRNLLDTPTVERFDHHLGGQFLMVGVIRGSSMGSTAYAECGFGLFGKLQAEPEYRSGGIPGSLAIDLNFNTGVLRPPVTVSTERDGRTLEQETVTDGGLLIHSGIKEHGLPSVWAVLERALLEQDIRKCPSRPLSSSRLRLRLRVFQGRQVRLILRDQPDLVGMVEAYTLGSDGLVSIRTGRVLTSVKRTKIAGVIPWHWVDNGINFIPVTQE